MTTVGIGAHAPAVFPGEFAAAQPAASPTVPTQIQVPTPTQGVRAEDLQTLAQTTIDGIAALNTAKAPLAGPTFTGILKAAEVQFSGPISITRTGYSQPVNEAGSWSVDSSAHWVDASTQSVLQIPVDVPTAAILHTINIYIKGAGGHGGTLPTLPSFSLQKRVLSTDVGSTPTQTGGTDPSANAAAYQAVHTLTLTLTGGHTVNRATSVYYLVLTGEGSVNGVNSLSYVGVDYSYDVTEVGLD